MNVSPARLFLLIIVLSLAACTVVPPTPTPDPVPATSAPLPTAGPTAAPPPTAIPPITMVPEQPVPPSALVLWAVAQGAELDALRALIADVSRAIKMDVVVVGKSADGVVSDVRANALAGLPLPDLVWGTQDELAVLREDDMLQPAADELASDTFLPAVISGATADGKRWGTPLAAQGYLLLLYNRKIVDSAPQTTDELITRAAQQTGGGRYGLVMAWSEPRWFTALLAGFGGTATDANGAPTLDTPEMQGALNLLRALRGYGPPPPSTYQDDTRLFRRGQVAYSIDGDWSLERYRAAEETVDLGIAPMPIVPATGRPSVSTMGGFYLMYNKTLAGDQLTHALALGSALTQPENQVRIARDLHRLPALRSALSDAAVMDDPALAAAAAHADVAEGLPPSEGLRCAWNAIRVVLPPMILGELPQDQAAGSMQSHGESCR